VRAFTGQQANQRAEIGDGSIILPPRLIRFAAAAKRGGVLDVSVERCVEVGNGEFLQALGPRGQ